MKESLHIFTVKDAFTDDDYHQLDVQGNVFRHYDTVRRTEGAHSLFPAQRRRIVMAMVVVVVDELAKYESA